MSIFLTRIDAVPLGSDELSTPLKQWLSILVDTLNEIIGATEGSFNLLTVQSYTAVEIAALTSLSDGILLYDSTNNVYVGKQAGVLVKFTTAAYP